MASAERKRTHTSNAVKRQGKRAKHAKHRIPSLLSDEKVERVLNALAKRLLGRERLETVVACMMSEALERYSLLFPGKDIREMNSNILSALGSVFEHWLKGSMEMIYDDEDGQIVGFDLVLDGEKVSVKFTVGDNWMIRANTVGDTILLLGQIDLKEGLFSIGLMHLCSDEFLNKGKKKIYVAEDGTEKTKQGNGDDKCTLKAGIGTGQINWIITEQPVIIPEPKPVPTIYDLIAKHALRLSIT